jgi:hypothetical protein
VPEAATVSDLRDFRVFNLRASARLRRRVPEAATVFDLRNCRVSDLRHGRVSDQR